MNSDKANKKEEVSVDKKLANLLLLGWTMLADTCPVETCKCPLMRSLDGKKYCCGCEAWENSAKIEKQEFKEIASNNIRKTKIEKEQQPKEIVKEEEKKEIIVTKKENVNEKVIKVLKKKLDYLTERLDKETDLSLIDQLTKSIMLNMDAIKKYEELNI